MRDTDRGSCHGDEGCIHCLGLLCKISQTRLPEPTHVSLLHGCKGKTMKTNVWAGFVPSEGCETVPHPSHSFGNP